MTHEKQEIRKSSQVKDCSHLRQICFTCYSLHLCPRNIQNTLTFFTEINLTLNPVRSLLQGSQGFVR